MRYTVRSYREGDGAALAALTQAAIRSVGAVRYSPAQINAWAARHHDAGRFVARVEQGHLIFVAADPADMPAAYAVLEPDGHLDMLYCHPDHTRRGLADRLLARAEREAVMRGIERLFTEASELARPSFERAGYAVSHRRDFTIEHAGQGVPIHNYAMEKALS